MRIAVVNFETDKKSLDAELNEDKALTRQYVVYAFQSSCYSLS